MDKVKVIFRKAKNPYTHEYEVIAFFPEIKANYGKILSYIHIGQHSEASVEFYWETKKATETEYKSLLEELKAISPVFEEDVYEAISMETCVNTRLTIGAPSETALKEVITLEEAYLAENKKILL